MKKCLLLGSVLLFIGCTNVIYDKPEKLISQEQMVEIWTDIMLGSAAKSLNTKELKKYKNLMPVILKKHRIDSVQFMESNRYYTARIDDYEKIFEQVENRLKDLKRTYNPREALLDSIQKNDGLDPTNN